MAKPAHLSLGSDHHMSLIGTHDDLDGSTLKLRILSGAVAKSKELLLRSILWG